MNLIDLVKQWLKDEMSGWKTDRTWNEEFVIIVYSKMSGYPVAELSDTNIKFLDDDLVIHAYDKNFFPLLSNRLYIAEQGFEKALAARDKHFIELDDERK